MFNNNKLVSSVQRRLYENRRGNPSWSASIGTEFHRPFITAIGSKGLQKESYSFAIVE